MSSLRRLGWLAAIAITLGAWSGVAEAAPAKKAPTHEKKAAKKGAKAGAKTPKGGLSVGAPNAGRLEGAVRLKKSKTLHLREGARNWGLPALVRALGHAADAVAKKHRGSVLLVGDLSAKTGGRLDRHNSHQTGRDADVAFYVANSNGKPVAVKHFVAFDGSGRGRELPWAHFDDARNWALVEALLKDEKAGVKYLFVTNALRARLLAFAAKKHVSKEMIGRAAAAMMSPPDADMHDDHFHVRIACPDTMQGVCVEESTARGDGADKEEAPKAETPAEAPKEAPKAEVVDRPAKADPGEK
jgi:penicillin-insensitive murein endopeptidase